MAIARQLQFQNFRNFVTLIFAWGIVRHVGIIMASFQVSIKTIPVGSAICALFYIQIEAFSLKLKVAIVGSLILHHTCGASIHSGVQPLTTTDYNFQHPIIPFFTCRTTMRPSIRRIQRWIEVWFNFELQLWFKNRSA